MSRLHSIQDPMIRQEMAEMRRALLAVRDELSQLVKNGQLVFDTSTLSRDVALGDPPAAATFKVLSNQGGSKGDKLYISAQKGNGTWVWLGPIYVAPDS